MYEGNVYMSFDDPMVIDNCQQSVMPKYQKPRILTMASSDVYSVIAYPHNMIAYSIKYADFNEPVPWSAYYFQSYCWNNHVACTEVIPDRYVHIPPTSAALLHLQNKPDTTLDISPQF
jgi:hypothetical protein